MQWRDGYPEMCCVDDTPCRDPTRRGQWLPPTISSHSVLVELDDEAGVAIDRAISMGDGKATWYIYGNRVTGWMPLPKARRSIHFTSYTEVPLDDMKIHGPCLRCNGAGGERWMEVDGSENGETCPRCGGFGSEP